MSFDPELFGKAMGEAIQKAIAPLTARVAELEKQLTELPTPEAGKDGKDGRDGIDGKDGEKGEKGEDGISMADLLIDRDGVLVATYTDGRMKSLGQVVGRDGKDGADGISLDSFEMEYLPETHEVSIKAQAGIRVKEVRYPAGGIQPGGYWRQGGEAKAGEAWTHDGSLWVARKDTKATPSTQSDEWVLMARKGRDGERGPRGKDGSAPAPIKLKDEDDEPDND